MPNTARTSSPKGRYLVQHTNQEIDTQIMRAFILLTLITPINALSLFHRIRSKLLPFTLPWYESGLQFSCTSCGKCCKVDGDVWLSPAEVDTIQNHLGVGEEEFKSKYGRAEVSDGQETWVCLKRKEGGCIFLNPVGQCSIYDVRPIQCETYPFWPSLLASRDDWKNEAVIPDDMELKENERYWTAELGGCEGISYEQPEDTQSSNDKTQMEDVSIVTRKEIVSKMKAAKKHWKSFPVEEIKQSTWYL